MRSITITRPDDWHVHLRDGDYLKDTVEAISRYFGRAIIMPNLVPALDTPDAVSHYREQILSVIPEDSAFEPLMTLYLSENTGPEIVKEAKQLPFVHAFKLYPAGATTNSESGISSIKSMYDVFDALQDHDLPLCIHGEVTSDAVDIFDREAAFIDEILLPLTQDFPRLRVVLEHITTRQAVDFVLDASEKVAATITAHHLLFNRNHMLAGAIRPIFYCLPILKRTIHQQALVDAAISGNPKFFLGTDSAPHPRTAKENICGCAAGCYTAHAAIELYAEAFDNVGELNKLEAFSSFFGPDFYQLPRNKDKITLIEESWQVPEMLRFGQDELIPIRSNEQVNWRVKV